MHPPGSQTHCSVGGNGATTLKGPQKGKHGLVYTAEVQGTSQDARGTNPLRSPQTDSVPQTTNTPHTQVCSNLFQRRLTHTRRGLYKQPQTTLISRVTQADTENDTVVCTGQLTTKQTSCGANKGSGQTGQSQESGKGQKGKRGIGAVFTFLGSAGHRQAQDTKATLECGPRHVTREQSSLLLSIYSETQPTPGTSMPTHLPPGTGILLPHTVLQMEKTMKDYLEEFSLRSERPFCPHHRQAYPDTHRGKQTHTHPHREPQGRACGD